MKTTPMPLWRTLLLALLSTSMLACTSAEKQAPAQATLYERLGGKEALTAVVNHLWGVVAADERINARFSNTKPEAFAGQLVDFLCVGSGGPCEYKGRNMYDAHKGMNLTEAEFMALGEDVSKTLDHFKVPAAEKQEVMNMLIGMKDDVINH